MKTCSKCGEPKPLDEFGRNARSRDGRKSTCLACAAAAMRELRKGVSPEEMAEQQKALRAGIRKNKCAVCGSAITGTGICSRCQGAIAVLGGLDGLKQAVRAVRYLEGRET